MSVLSLTIFTTTFMTTEFLLLYSQVLCLEISQLINLLFFTIASVKLRAQERRYEMSSVTSARLLNVFCIRIYSANLEQQVFLVICYLGLAVILLTEDRE